MCHCEPTKNVHVYFSNTFGRNKKKRREKNFSSIVAFLEWFEVAVYWARSYAIFRLFLVYRAIKAKSVAKLRVHRFQRCRKEYEMGENGVYATATPARVLLCMRIRVDGTCRHCVLASCGAWNFCDAVHSAFVLVWWIYAFLMSNGCKRFEMWTTSRSISNQIYFLASTTECTHSQLLIQFRSFYSGSSPALVNSIFTFNRIRSLEIFIRCLDTYSGLHIGLKAIKSVKLVSSKLACCVGQTFKWFTLQSLFARVNVNSNLAQNSSLLRFFFNRINFNSCIPRIYDTIKRLTKTKEYVRRNPLEQSTLLFLRRRIIAAPFFSSALLRGPCRA